ncbi:unnamed protein product, partial [Arabidopsis halleri]
PRSGNWIQQIGAFGCSNPRISMKQSESFLHQISVKEIQDETDRETGRSKAISSVPIHLSIYSPNVVNLTLKDLPGLTKVVVDGQSDSIVKDIENMVRSYIEKVNENAYS